MHEITITTFGYLHAPAPTAHITLDLREHFRDPHISPELRSLTAHDAPVREAVRTTPGISDLIAATEAAVCAYLAGPSAGPLAIAVGCAGGRHRAAVTGELLATTLSENPGLAVTLTHRDLGKPEVRTVPVYVTFADRHTLTTKPTPVRPGTVLTESELLAVTDLRRVPVGELVFDQHFRNRVDFTDVLDGTATARLLQVRPLGTPERYSRDGAEVYYPPAAGWEVVGDAPVAGLLGPQAAEVTTAAALAGRYLRGDTDASAEAGRYYAVAAATSEELDDALNAALAALGQAGADVWWWGTAVSCAYGHELVAIGARDLIGTVPEWTPAAYDTLTAPWRAAAFEGLNLPALQAPEVPREDIAALRRAALLQDGPWLTRRGRTNGPASGPQS